MATPPTKDHAEPPAIILPAAALSLFLALQAASLALSAARVEFSAAFASPAEGAAVHQLLVIQAIAITLLFPWVCRTIRSAAVCAASLWPMLVLASLLAGRPAADILAPAMLLPAWLVAMILLSYTLRTERSRLLGLAVAAAWCAAGPLAWYLRLDFADEPPVSSWLVGPLRGAMLLLDGESDWRIWISCLAASAITLVISISYKSISKKRDGNI